MSADTMIREARDVLGAAREIAPAARVGAVLDRLSAEVTARLRDACPIVLAVMQGGVFTATELARRLSFPYEFDYVHLTRYGKALEGGAIEWLVRPHAALRGRDVLIVDDIFDRGDTLCALQAELRALGVARVHTVVLVTKDLDQPQPRPAIDFVGMSVGDSYVFGCGMDYKGFWRGLPALYAID